MPTTLPRIQVTETGDLAAALDRAAQRWPGEPRSTLLVRLATLGAASLESDAQAARTPRRAAIERLGEAYEDGFPADYLAAIREDWPA